VNAAEGSGARSAALENPGRARLYECVLRQPGITIQDAAEAARVARTTATYHLQVLVREGLLVARSGRKTVHYFPRGTELSAERQAQLQVLASERTRAVAELLAKHPGTPRSEIANALGITIATVNWHLRPLMKHRLLREVAEDVPGHLRRLYPTDAMRECFDALGAKLPPAASADAKPKPRRRR
jgi:predicted transcriptional regulator